MSSAPLMSRVYRTIKLGGAGDATVCLTAILISFFFFILKPELNTVLQIRKLFQNSKLLWDPYIQIIPETTDYLNQQEQHEQFILELQYHGSSR